MARALIEGHCLWGAVSIKLEQPKQSIEICHCDMCKRWGGAFYSALAGEAFVVEGEDKVAIYRSSKWAERAFCKICGSNLWYRFLPTGNRSFLAGLFADAIDLPVEREIFVERKAAWCELAGEHARLTGKQFLAEAEEAGFSFD